MSPDIYDSTKDENVNPEEVLDNYEPSEKQMHRLNALIDIVKKCDEEDLEIVLLGGYALDGLYGKITRPHSDIDLLVGGVQKEFDKFKKILEELEYDSDTNETDQEKGVYRNKNTDPDFKVEFAALSALNNFITKDENIELYIPKEDNASLNGQTFKALTLYGCKRAIEIQNDRSKERNWGEYPEEKRNNQKLLIEFLEKREEEKNVQ
jgi:hypothetical protein